jgi:hypothetical protein
MSLGQNWGSWFGIERVGGEFRKRPEFWNFFGYHPEDGDIFTLFLHAIVIIIRLSRPGGLPFRCCRIRFDATSSPDSESGSEAGSQPSGFGSDHRRSVHFTNASGVGSAIRHCVKAIHAVAFS